MKQSAELPAVRQSKRRLLVEPEREAETLKNWYASNPRADSPRGAAR